jgi:hypothetical protein
MKGIERPATAGSRLLRIAADFTGMRALGPLPQRRSPKLVPLSRRTLPMEIIAIKLKRTDYLSAQQR